MKRSLLPFASAAATLAAAPLALAQEQDPFAAKPNPFETPLVADAAAAGVSGILSICYETFSLDLASAAPLLRADQPDAALYEHLVALVADGKAKQESLAVVRVRSGQRAICESIAEYIYPTEWNPAEIPNSVGIQLDPSKAAAGNPAGAAGAGNPAAADQQPLFTSPVSPTAFETRNLGFTLEVEPLIHADGQSIELTIAPQHVTLTGETSYGQGVSTLEVPEIESQQVSMGINAQAEVPRLIGTMNRPPVSKIDPESATRIFLAFVTISHVRN
jgi:hypothetical protein